MSTRPGETFDYFLAHIDDSPDERPQLFLTTAQAAALSGMTPGVFRAQMARERANGNEMRIPRDQWTDSRSPAYDIRKIRAWITGRMS